MFIFLNRLLEIMPRFYKQHLFLIGIFVLFQTGLMNCRAKKTVWNDDWDRCEQYSDCNWVYSGCCTCKKKGVAKIHREEVEKALGLYKCQCSPEKENQKCIQDEFFPVNDCQKGRCIVLEGRAGQLVWTKRKGIIAAEEKSCIKDSDCIFLSPPCRPNKVVNKAKAEEVQQRLEGFCREEEDRARVMKMANASFPLFDYGFKKLPRCWRESCKALSSPPEKIRNCSKDQDCFIIKFDHGWSSWNQIEYNKLYTKMRLPEVIKTSVLGDLSSPPNAQVEKLLKANCVKKRCEIALVHESSTESMYSSP